jgi:hypothetical protein
LGAKVEISVGLNNGVWVPILKILQRKIRIERSKNENQENADKEKHVQNY